MEVETCGQLTDFHNTDHTYLFYYLLCPTDGKGHKLELAEIYEAPTSGVTLQLTIDIELQQAVENELDNAMSKYDAESAIAIAMESKL